MQPEEFIGQIEEPRRSDIRRIHELIRSTAPELTPVVAGKMLGYGPYHYKYATGREGDTTVLSLANNKNYMSLYVFCADEHGYLAERYRDVLPKADIGKSCVRIKKLDDVDVDALRELIAAAAAMGGADAAR